MTLDTYLREVLREEIRTVLREEMNARPSPPTAEPAGDYLSMKQVLKMTGFSEPTIAKWAKEGHFKKHGRGRAVRYRRTEVEHFLASRPTPSVEPDIDELADAMLAPRRG